MATEKVSLTLDQRVLREAKRIAGKRGLSAYVNDALRLRLQGTRIRAFVEETEQLYGPIPDSIRKQVRAEWAGKPAKRRRRS